jgi:uncharacterized protein (TIGR03067 family)
MKYVLAAVTLLVLVGTASAQFGQAFRPQHIPADVVARSQEWVQVLAQDLDQLRENVRREVRNPDARRDLERRCDDLLGDVLVFQRVLPPGVPAGTLARRYQDIDGKLEALLGELSRVPPQDYGVALATRRLRVSDTRLHQLLAQVGGRGGVPGGSSFDRQARALEFAVRDLDEIVRASVPPGQAANDLHQHARHVQEELREFRTRAAAGADLGRLRKDYLGVHLAWDRFDLTLYRTGLQSNAAVRSRWLRARSLEEALAQALRLDDVIGGNALDRLQGRWALVSIYSDGIPQDLSAFGKQYFVFNGDAWQITEGGQVISAATFRVFDTDGPIKKMDSFIQRGKDRGTKAEAIFTFRGSMLYFAPGQVRPRDFGQNYYTVWRKVD